MDLNDNFVLTVKNLLNEQECNNLIELYNKDLTNAEQTGNNYQYNQIDINTFPYLNKLDKLSNLYINKYPEANLTASYWNLSELRFKLFKKGKYFDTFHSETSFYNPYRFLSLQIYLTDHNCGTEFYNGNTIISEIGKACIFPAYFTHTHKGQPDYDKERIIITGYYSFMQ